MKFRFLFTLLLVSALPFIAEAAPRTFRELTVDLVDILSATTATVLALAVVIFIWGIAKNITALGENKIKERNAYILWGTIILFVMVSVWGILGLLRNTLFQGDRSGSYLLETLPPHV